MTFSFNFVDDGDQDNQPPTHAAAPPVQNSRPSDEHSSSVRFSWIEKSQLKYLECLQSEQPHDLISISPDFSLKAVRDTKSTAEYQTTDLIPGVYEGGLKVWECSIDLCRHLSLNDVNLEGWGLELGCGHGLPGCFALKKARSTSTSTTRIVFSDYNDFVLKEVTVPNIALNLKHSGSSTDDTEQLVDWISNHAILGAGDWNIMSERLDKQQSGEGEILLPVGGKFDFILAAETTYSEKAARETAELVMRHLKVGTGVAFVASKRYYFGVGGGSDAFREAFSKSSSDISYTVESIEIFDDGSSNIRELLKVTASARSIEMEVG